MLTDTQSIIRIISSFPLKIKELDADSTLGDAINLFGSLMISRVRSLLEDTFPGADFSSIAPSTTISNLAEIASQNPLTYSSISKTAKPKANSLTKQDSKDILHSSEANDLSKVSVSILGVGIDIESIDNLPVDLFTEESASFRRKTFHPEEVAYASLKTSPLETILGIYCAKEAVIKSSPESMCLDLLDVMITHRSDGAPICEIKTGTELCFKISISHSNNYACAVSVCTKSSALPI